ncbi:MAG: hypothetical protein L6R00_02025 [Phycisphaerae bacterium]|nr:hypothetical protein [Phycisphaerae bacterium]
MRPPKAVQSDDVCGTSIDSGSRGGKRRGTLVVAPYVGEFGWELMNWQAFVRAQRLRRPAARWIVFGDEGKRRLYEAPGVEFVHVSLDGLPGESCNDGRIDECSGALAPESLWACVWALMRPHLIERDLCAADASAPLDGIHVIRPDYDGRLWPAAPPHQAFESLARRPADASGARLDVVLVPRQRALAGLRGQAASWWETLADQLVRRGLRVAVAPARFDEAVTLFSTCRLAAGGSTGGLHLASLCACPHYVWGGGDEERWTGWEISNRQRYETFWNPLGTPARYEPLGWRPAVSTAVEGIVRALDCIGRRGARDVDGAAARRFRRRWALKRRCAAWSIAPGEPWLPWRVRRWLAEAC